MKHLTQDEADALQRYITRVRDLMNLEHWDVYLTTKPADGDAWASVEPVDGRYVAPVRVCKKWTSLAPEVQRSCIVHELLHLAHRDLSDLVRLSMAESGYLPGRAYRLLWTTFKRTTEQMVDHLTGVIAPTMPLPEVVSDE